MIAGFRLPIADCGMKAACFIFDVSTFRRFDGLLYA
jgi:hypothetical protein